MAENIILKDKQGEQLLPYTKAENIIIGKTQNKTNAEDVINDLSFGGSGARHLTDPTSAEINAENRIRKARMQGKVIFEDDFDEFKLDNSKWHPETKILPSRFSGSERQYYTDDGNNILLHNSIAKIFCRWEGRYKNSPTDTLPLTSMSLTTENICHFSANTRMEARIKLDTDVRGLWPAFWLWQADYEWGNMSNNGFEIDLFEYWSGNQSFACNFHWTDSSGQAKSSGAAINRNTYKPDLWHIYAVEILQDSIKYYIDDNLIHSISLSDEAMKKLITSRLKITLNVASGGNANTPSENINGKGMSIDWVRVMALTDDNIYPATLDVQEENITVKSGDVFNIYSIIDASCINKTVIYDVVDEDVITNLFQEGAHKNLGGSYANNVFKALKVGTTDVFVKTLNGLTKKVVVTVTE